MRTLLTVALVMAIALPVVAFDLGNRAPDKPATAVIPPPADPAVLRQGGDTIADAVEIYMFYIGSGTTAGYTDDYDEVCPYSGSTSPDVVYTFVATSSNLLTVDLFGSSYDTKVYLYDENLTLVACNDDFYSDYTSRLDAVSVMYGVRYYIVIDGYGGDYGEYQIEVTEVVGDTTHCPAGGVWEDEPELVDGYIDEHNGGCNSIDDIGYAPFQHISSGDFCGYAGWYLSASGSNHRDTDWFTVTIPASGSLNIVGSGDQWTNLYELGPQDCDSVGVLQSVMFGQLSPAGFTVTGVPGTDAWIWVGSTVFEQPPGAPDNEYLYVLHLEGVVAVKNHSWSDVKTLFD